MWSWQRLTKIQTTTRPDHLWPEIWSGISKDSSTKSRAAVGYREAEARPCAKVERHLSIDPVLVKYHQYRETCGESDNHKSKHACNVEPHESTKRLERTLPKDHGDRIAGKGFNSLSQKYLVKKFIPMPQAMQNPDAKAAVDKEWEELEKLPAWVMTIVNSKKKDVFLEAQKDRITVHVTVLIDICHLKNAELEPKFQKDKGRVALRSDMVKDDSGSHAVFTEQDSSASQMTAAKVMDVISRLPDCAGQADDAVSAHTQVEMESFLFFRR